MKMQPLAVITEAGTPGSVELHERFGFRPIGTLEAVGIKHDQWIDTFLMQRALRRRPPSEPLTPSGYPPGLRRFFMAGPGAMASSPCSRLRIYPDQHARGSARRLLKAQPVVAVM